MLIREHPWECMATYPEGLFAHQLVGAESSFDRYQLILGPPFSAHLLAGLRVRDVII